MLAFVNITERNCSNNLHNCPCLGVTVFEWTVKLNLFCNAGRSSGAREGKDRRLGPFFCHGLIALDEGDKGGVNAAYPTKN